MNISDPKVQTTTKQLEESIQRELKEKQDLLKLMRRAIRNISKEKR